MGSGSNRYTDCIKIYDVLDATYTLLSSSNACNYSHNLIQKEDIWMQYEICASIYDKEVLQGSYSKPMLWIGIYIAVASLLCILAMAADLFHGFRNKKLWFPSKYFTLNVASIMVITIAMKLPVDLNDPMPGWADQFAKMGSMPFMSAMMANLMPSLASMDDNELFENVIGLLILVVTIVVNVIIQMVTGVLDRTFITYIFIGTMLYLLIVLTSLALTTPASKHILEIKYQAAHKMESESIHSEHTKISTVEELIQRVRRYSIMAGTCSPQFVMATTPLCSAAGIICVCNTMAYFYHVLTIIIINRSYAKENVLLHYYSDYKWSMLVIFITQSVGVVVGTIAPVFRCFAALSFKLSITWCKGHIKIFQVESYWIKKLSEWKEIDLLFPIGSRTLKVLVHNLNNLIINVCIRFQKIIVVSSKMIALIPIGIVIFGVYCVYCWKALKAMFFPMLTDSNGDIIHRLEKKDTDGDIDNYVLQLQDEMKLGKRTLKCISNTVDHLIQKAEKKLPNNLLKLVEQSTGFEGVVKFDSDKVPSLISIKLPESWSLPVVTLTCIAITLPNICKDIVDSLFNSVCEGLLYTFIVEESLNNATEAKNIQRATKTLWHEVEVSYKWLGNSLQINDFKEKTPKEILKWFADKAEEIVSEINKTNNEVMLENSLDKLIAANSMYRLTHTTMLNCNYNDHIREEQLFALLSGMIANIVVACLTNLPHVISMKCHESVIEKRESSVHNAAKLLGSTNKIIERLHACELPSLDPDQMAFIDEWRVYLKQSIP